MLSKENMIMINPRNDLLKNKQLMPFVAIRMTLEIIILSEAYQMEKCKYHAFTYTTDLQISEGVFGYQG